MKKHNGTAYHPLRRTWDNMKTRCYNANNEAYKYYGARGVKVCDSWLNSFKNFIDDMGNRPEGMTLDRIDNDGNYEPSNCRWATLSEQNKNRHFDSRGEKSKTTTLCNEKIFKIRALAGHLTQKEIASIFAISRETVSSIITRRNWNHI